MTMPSMLNKCVGMGLRYEPISDGGGFRLFDSNKTELKPISDGGGFRLFDSNKTGLKPISDGGGFRLFDSNKTELKPISFTNLFLGAIHA